MNCGPSHNHSSSKARKLNSAVLWIVAASAGAYYLWGWHREHVLQYWPLAIVLLCPLMHLFGGHGGHGGHQREDKEATR